MYDTYLGYLGDYLSRQEQAHADPSVSKSSSTSSKTTNIHHHYHDSNRSWSGPSWYGPSWYGPSWFGPNSYPTVNHYHYGDISHATSNSKDKKKDEGVTALVILTGLFFGGVMLGSFRYFAGRYLDYSEEHRLLKGLENRKDTYLDLYRSAHTFLNTNSEYSWNMFVGQLVFGGSGLSLLANWLYLNDVSMMNMSFVWGCGGGAYLIWQHLQFNARKNYLYLPQIRTEFDKLNQSAE